MGDQYSKQLARLDLKAELDDLKEMINSFNDNKVNLNSELLDELKDLSNRKGSFLGIEYSKSPTADELLDICIKNYNCTEDAFTQVYKHVKELHKTDERIFRIMLMLNNLSVMGNQRLAGSYSLIKEARRDIEVNCKVTNALGKQIKDLAMLHLQHINKEKKFYFFNSVGYKIGVGIVALIALICSLLF